jgi:hypothetical protein
MEAAEQKVEECKMNKTPYQKAMEQAVRLGAEVIKFQRRGEWLFKLDDRMGDVLFELACATDENLAEYKRASADHPEDLPQVSERLAHNLSTARFMSTSCALSDSEGGGWLFWMTLVTIETSGLEIDQPHKLTAQTSAARIEPFIAAWNSLPLMRISPSDLPSSISVRNLSEIVSRLH